MILSGAGAQSAMDFVAATTGHQGRV